MGCENQKAVDASTPALAPVERQKRQARPKAKSPQQAQGKIQLDIPIRFQWENAGGYCGETSVQACSIYYGNYISQTEVRKLGGSELLLGENAEKTVKKLGYEIDVWDNQSEKPQYKRYLQWIKKNIQQGYPVITCGYDPEGKNDEYDHIYMAVGVISDNINEYSDQDTLIYMDLFDEDYTETKFGEIWDTRSMKNNGANLDFAIPKNMNYGIAVKGYANPNDIFMPIRLELENQSEPNVTTGQQPIQFEFKVNISELQQGKRYALLRYDNFKKLPKNKVEESEAISCYKFVAEGSQFQKTEKVMSNGMAFFRCVEEENLE